MNKTIIGSLVLILACMVNACKINHATAQTDSKLTEEKGLPLVKLRDFKKNKAGAYILFDGTSLKGWRGYAVSHVPNKWSIEDGALKFTGKPNIEKPEGGDLIFAHNFKNFELEFEWRVAKGANSGVFYLAKEIKGKPIYISAPEYQVLDNENHPDAKLGTDGNRKSASLYDMIPAKPQNSKPFGEWNSSKIIVNNGKVQHFQNGVKVVEYTLWDSSWVSLLEAGKFSSAKWPEAFALLKNVGGESKSGFIGLQDHGDDVWYRNVTVKVLK